MNKEIRVAAYARVSTDKDDQLNSLKSQKSYFSDYIKSHETWNLVKVYSDEGITGTSTKQRKGFKELINDAMLGKIDLIITKEVSRFARNTVDALKITRDLREKNIGVLFLLDSINTLDKDGELRLTLMASLAQEESRKTSERVKWGQRRQMEKGVVFGRSLLGYAVKDGKLILKENEAEIVKMIFHKFVNEKKGTYTIAREMNETDIKPQGKWTATAISRILHNEKYVGDLIQKKTITKSYLDHKKSRNRGEEEIIYIKDHHPKIAIISRKMWNEAQSELKKRTLSAEEKSKYSNRYWASGKIKCGVCGGVFVKKNKGNSNYWCCSNRVKSESFRIEECNMDEYINDNSLKDIILVILKNIINKDTLKSEITNEVLNVKKSDSEILCEKSRQTIEKLTRKKSNLIDLRLSNEISKEDFILKKAQIEDEIKKCCVENSLDSDMDITMHGIIKEIEKILKFDDRNIDSLLKMVTESVTILRDHTVIIKMVNIPYLFKIKFSTKGKLDTYSTEIKSFDIICE